MFQSLYILIEGSLEATISPSESAGLSQEIQTLGRVTPGQILGEISFVSDRLPIFTVTAIEESEVLAISCRELSQKLQQDREFAAHFYEIASQSLSRKLKENTALLAVSKMLPIPPLRKVLLMFAIFQDVDLNWILSASQTQKWSANTILIREQEPVSALYILLDGTLEVSIQIQEEKKALATLESGEILGEISFVEAGNASATLTCLEKISVVALPRDRLASQLQENLGFSARFYQAIAVVLADRLRDRFQQRGYGGNAHETGESLDFDLEYADELDMDMLEKTAIAGSRFDWFLRQAKSRT
ncbi:cyclic nucleotide-binding domain-containing protein [Spirulina sp. 06S082]|uniref:cyclic nucleotide-binding domain-containing protein n=1 Tax=Spirulina sp. 06S082 TaxID=3110248 RepID=UPI002B1ED803|nr:cyclic nucleotide-binding domain-containing protein [Spirulina sp. 06S082]MEA5472583.1 cyclic nucleotide-binding domain-containing protein [Spirulina sp. 06S082]